MYLLNPESVTFGTLVLDDVQTLVVNRTAEKPVAGWSDLGPYVAFADVVEQRVSVRIVRRLSREQVQTVLPGDEGVLRVIVTPSGARSDVGRHALVATCVVMSVTHELISGKNATQTIVMEAVSATGAANPVSTELMS